MRPSDFDYFAVTPTGPSSGFTHVYRPDPTMSVTVYPRQAFRIGVVLIRDAILAALRRDTVTFEAVDDTAPYTFELEP